MRQLFLMRHAAAESIGGHDDKLRSLSFQGKGELVRVVATRLGLFDEVSCVLCSSAIRTRQTLDAIQEILHPSCEIHYLDSLYHAAAATIIEEISLVDDKHKGILVVGHNPGISHLANDVLKISGLPAKPIVSTAGIVYFQNTKSTWHQLQPKDLSYDSSFLAERAS